CAAEAGNDKKNLLLIIVLGVGAHVKVRVHWAMKLRYSEILPENSGGGVSLGSFGVRSAGGCWRSTSRAARRALAVASCSANCCKSSRLGSGVAGVSESS